MEPHTNETITSHGFPSVIVLEEAGPLLARVRVEYHLQVPAGIDDELTAQFRGDADDHTARTKERKTLVVTSRFTLRAGQRRLDVTTSLDNQCRNHRLRVMLPTGLKAAVSHSEASYDVIARDITVKKGNAYYGRPNPQYPMYRWVDLADGKKGFAVLNTGIREYEAVDNKERTLAITLFRAYTYRNCPIFGRWEVHPEMDLAQCIGPHEWTYSIYPHKGDWTNGVFNEAEELNTPLDPAQCGPHKGTLPKQLSFLTVSGGNVQFTALKQHEDRPGSYTVRVFNPEAKTVTAKLQFAKPIKKAWLCNLNEERRTELKTAGKVLNVPLTKKKIATIELTF